MDFCYLFQVILILSYAWRASSTGSAGVSLQGRCSECLSNGVACLDERTFLLCLNGTITNTSITCPLGLYCSDHKHICVSLERGMRPICRQNDCGSCAQSGGRFACLNETSYGFCYGSTTVREDAVRQCPDDLVCNVHMARICSRAETTIPSCVPTTQPTTEASATEKEVDGEDRATEAFVATETSNQVVVVSTETSIDQQITTESSKVTVDPDTFCGKKQTPGLFKDESDKSCKRYFQCFLLAGQYLGSGLKCKHYYNEVISDCQDEKPADC